MAQRIIRKEGTRRVGEPSGFPTSSSSRDSEPLKSSVKEKLKAKVKKTPVPNGAEHHPTPSRTTYTNPNNCKQLGPIDVAKAMISKKFTPVPLPAEENLVPVHKPDWGKGKSGLKATWLGHASWLLDFPIANHAHERGVRVLTDPIWSERSSPVNFIGPKRYRSTPCNVEELPLIDIICISHNHYDHCDVPAIKQIFKNQPNNPPMVFVALGVQSLMVTSGIPAEYVIEMDWWDQQTLTINAYNNDLETFLITCTPAQHNSGRSPLDQNKTLWCSWSLNHVETNTRVFFAGDTGYRPAPGGEPNPAFKQIGKTCGPFSLGLIPIGNYAPERLMAMVHCTPAEAIEIHWDVGARRSLAMHWGTRHAGMSQYFMDAMEPKKEFFRRREEMLQGNEESFSVCEIGETVAIDEAHPAPTSNHTTHTQHDTITEPHIDVQAQTKLLETAQSYTGLPAQ